MEQEELRLKIIDYRARNNISMLEFGQRCHIGIQTVFNIENRKHKPSRRTIQKIVTLLDDEIL